MKPFKRLKYKTTLADLQQIQDNVFNTLGKDGRDVLKVIDDYKYKIAQFSEIVADEKGKKKISECIKDLDNVSAFIYSFVYELENYELVEDFDKKLEFDVPEDIEEDIEVEEVEEVKDADTEDIVDENTEEDFDFDEENPFEQAAQNDENFEEPAINNEE